MSRDRRRTVRRVADDDTNKLGKGARVEVLLIDHGLRGSWHPAVVKKVLPGIREVEFEQLLRDGKTKDKLVGKFPVGKGVDEKRCLWLRSRPLLAYDPPPKGKGLCVPVGKGVGATDVSSLKAAIVCQKPLLRLRPPPPPVNDPPPFVKGLCVDVHWKDAWWEGVLEEDITSLASGPPIRVFFPDEDSHETCIMDDVRVGQVWDDVTGQWSLKGYRNLLKRPNPGRIKGCMEQELKPMKVEVDSDNELLDTWLKRKDCSNEEATSLKRRVEKGKNVERKKSRLLPVKADPIGDDTSHMSGFGGPISPVVSDTDPSYVQDTVENLGNPMKRRSSRQQSDEKTGHRQRGKFIRKRSYGNIGCPNVGNKCKKRKWTPSEKVEVAREMSPPHSPQSGTPTSRVPLKGSPAPGKRGKKVRKSVGFRKEVILSAPDPTSREGQAMAETVYAKKNILSWLIDIGMLARGQKVTYRHRHKNLELDGKVTPDGVLCGHCNEIVTLCAFELHCGSKVRHPCSNIYLEDGRSLTECQMEALKKQNFSMGSWSSYSWKVLGRRRGRSLKLEENALDKNDDSSAGDNSDDTWAGDKSDDTWAGDTSAIDNDASVVDNSDDICGVCGDGGDLICCDHCPSTFHLTCVNLEVVPDGEWYCPDCRCATCGKRQFSGDCQWPNPMSALFCEQCGRHYHVKCVPAGRLPHTDYRPHDTWLCCLSCAKVYTGLRSLVGITNILRDGFSWTLVRSPDEDPELESRIDREVLVEHGSKLVMALSVMQECFKPMIDPCMNVDLIAHALYNRGSAIQRLNFRGFYTILLEKGDEIMSVATVSVIPKKIVASAEPMETRLAEMPLIGTRFQYRRQGMCRRLVQAVEKMLQMVGVEALVLPAVPELLETWMGPFSFRPMDSCLKRTVIELKLMAFPGTTMLYKPLLASQGKLAVLGARLKQIARRQGKFGSGVIQGGGHPHEKLVTAMHDDLTGLLLSERPAEVKTTDFIRIASECMSEV